MSGCPVLKLGVICYEHYYCQFLRTLTTILVKHVSGELKSFYSLVPVAFVGGSLVHGLAGHNLAEPAAAGCVVLTGIIEWNDLTSGSTLLQFHTTPLTSFSGLCNIWKRSGSEDR